MVRKTMHISFGPLIRMFIRCVAAGGIALLQIGCVVGPKYEKPSVETPAVFKEVAPQQAGDGSQWKSASSQETKVRGKWWEIYHDPNLNVLEEKLNLSNQNIAQSFNNFMAARAQIAEAKSNYFPTISTSPSYTRSRTSGSSGTPSASGNNFDLPFDVSWEPDLWGKFRNTVRQYRNAAQVSAAELANERLTEQANLAVYYFELCGQDALQDLYDQTVEADRKSLNLMMTLSRTGIDDQQSVAQARLTLTNAQAAATNFGVLRAQYEHAIATLIGEPASAFSLPHRPLTTTVPFIPVGVPSELLERRPDIASAERTMSEANALIGIETAAFYPSVTLSFDGGFQSSSFTRWFSWPSRFFSLGPTVSQTLFDAGLRQATVEQYTATYNADVASYRQTVLTAFQQTEDYVSAIRILGVEIDQQHDAVKAAQDYYDLAQKRYRLGIDPFLDVFTAQTSLLGDQQTAITLEVQQMTNTVQLIEALGGGWSTAELPSETVVDSAKP